MDDSERVLTLSDLVSGKDKVEAVFIKELGASVMLRPLDLSEQARAQGTAFKAIKVNAKMPMAGGTASLADADVSFNMKDYTIAEAESQILIASMGLSCNGVKCSVDDVKKIKPASAVKAIAKAVLRLSGIDKEVEQRLNLFRSLTGRENASSDDAVRDAVDTIDKGHDATSI